MHGRQQHPEGDEENQQFVQCFFELFVLHLFGENRRKFDPEHQNVGSDAEGDFHQNRVEIDIPGKEQMPAVPVAADIQENGNRRQGIAEGTGQHGGADQRMVFPPVKKVHQDGHGIPAASEGRAHQDIVGNPKAPGVAVTEIGDGSEAVDVPIDHQHDAREGQDGQYHKRFRDDFSPYRATFFHHDALHNVRVNPVWWCFCKPGKRVRPGPRTGRSYPCKVCA